MIIDIFKYLKPKEEEEKEKEKPGWSQRTKGIGELPKYETPKKVIDLSKYIVLKGEAKTGVGAKAKGTVKLETKKEEPNVFDTLNESIEKNYKQYQSIAKKLEAYQAEYDYAPDNIKPTIAANFNKLVEEQGALVKQLQSEIKERDWVIGTKYKDAFMKFKQLTGLPDLSGEPTEKPKEIAPGFKKVEDTKLFAYKEPEKDIIAKIKERVSGIFREKPLEGIAKAQNIVAISKETGLPIDTIEKNYEKMGRALGMRGIPTTSEYLSAMFVFPVTAAIISNPISAGIGITKFLAMVEAENLIISKAKGWEYKFGAGKRLKDLTPDNTSQITKDIIDVVDFLAKGVIIRTTDPGIKAMWQKFTKDVVKTHTPSQRIYLSGQKIRDLHKVDPKLATQLEKDVYTNLPKKAEAIRTAFKKGGIDIEVPVQTITKIADKPYWAKIKGLFNIKTYSKTIVSDIKGKWTVHPAGFLPEPALGTKLYAGVPIDEMVKSIVAAGKLIPSIVNQLKVMNPVDTGLVFQQLSMVAPGIAAKVASQFVELIPQKITKVPKAGEEMTLEELEAFEKLKVTKIIPEGVEPTKAELEAIEKPLTKEKFEEVFKVAKEKVVEPEKFEPEPTPEEIRKVFMDKEHLETTVKNREFFLSKFGKLFTETKAAEDTLVKQKFNEMNMMVEYEEDDIFRIAFGKEKMRIPETTKTEWMEGLGKSRYIQIFRKDPNLQYPDEIASNLGISENELREQIIERIRTAPREVTLESAKQALIDEGNAVFLQVDAQMDAYKILLDEIEGGEYSFDTPKNVKRLNDKISSLKRDSKKLMAQYEEKITAIQKEGIEKRFEELKKITEAEKKVEVEIGIKKGLKIAKAELKGRAIKGMPEKEIKEGNKLIKEIQIMVKNRGFTKKQFSDIKMEKGGARSLSGKTRRMTIPQLKAVLRAVELARPRKIGAKQVVSLKTENKIQSLKNTLIEEQQMNEKRYKEILKEEGIYKEPKYIDAIHFITEKKGKKLIYRLLNESNILKITEPYRKAREAAPEIKKVWDKLSKRKETMGERDLRDPTDLQSMRYYFQKMGIITGADFFPVYRSLIDTNLECRYDLHKFIESFDKFKEVIKDKKRLKVSESWILAKNNLEGTPKVAKDITEEEIELAKKVESYLKDSQPMARTQQFLDNIENLEKLPQYNQYRKEMNKAKDIFESKGLGPLEEYLKDQKWGVITSGYDPMQVISPKVRDYVSSPLAFGKGNIKFRTDIEYQEQEKDMIQRVVAYKKSMDNLSKVREKLVALFQLTNNNLSKFKNPNKIKDNVEIFARELRGYNTPKNMFDRIFVRAYAMAMKTIVMPSPVLSIGRNLVLGQNMAIGHDKGMLIDPRNKVLTKDDIEFVEKYVLQSEFMKLDWFESREKPWPGLGWLIKLVEKVALYPWSDSANRWWCFWGKINLVNRAFEELAINSTAEEIEGMMWKAKFSDFRLDEQMMAMDILALDGPTAMKRYITKTYTDDIHFIYQRAQRALAEMGRVGRLLGNLMLWARAYWEKLFYHAGKVTGKDIPFKERWRGLEVLSNVIIGGLLVGAAYMKVTGRREAPYHPLNLLAYTPGGLQIGTVEAVGAIYANIILAVKGDKRALASLATDFPHAADMFIPFYDYALRAVEASTDTKNIDIKALRKVRMLLDKEYKLRGGAYVVKRNAWERWQYFLAGAGVDVTIKEREKAEKEKGKFPTIKFPEKSKFTKPKFPKRP